MHWTRACGLNIPRNTHIWKAADAKKRRPYKESSRAGFPYHSQPSQTLPFTINLSRFFSSPTSLICGPMSLNQKASLSQNTGLIPHNIAKGGCRTTIASLQLHPKLLNLIKLWPQCTGRAKGMDPQNISAKAQGIRINGRREFYPTCVCPQPAAKKHRGWKLKLQIRSAHITPITLEKKYLLN